MQLPASCFMQPSLASATIRLRSLDSADALEALDEMWKLQAQMYLNLSRFTCPNAVVIGVDLITMDQMNCIR